MGGQLGEIVDKFAADFNASQSDYELKAVYKGNYTETMTSAIAAFRAKEQPHIVQVFEVGTATMMAAEDKGAVYPVHELMTDAGEPFDQSEYLPAVISYYTTADNKLLSLPFNSSTPCSGTTRRSLTNSALTSRQAGRSLKRLPRRQRRAVFRRRSVSAGSPGPRSRISRPGTMSRWARRENGFTGLDTAFTFNNDHVVNHIQRIADMGAKGLFEYGGRRGDSRAKFVNGESVFWINSSAYYGGFKKDIKDFEFGQAMLPLDTGVASAPQNSIIGGATLWVLKGHDSDAYKGVAKFFKFLSAPEQQAYWHQTTGYVPITTAAYELSRSQGFYESNPGTDTAIKQLSLNEPTPASKGLRFGNFVQIRDIINEELESVWAGQKSAKDALDKAVDRGNALLRKFEKANR